MRVIKNGYERKFICPKCNSIILFNMDKDKKLTTSDGVVYFNCPICNKSNIITDIPKVEENK